jgi:hypothetical protein
MKVYYEVIDTDREAHKYIRMRHTPDVMPMKDHGERAGGLYVSCSPEGTNSQIEEGASPASGPEGRAIDCGGEAPPLYAGA